ncbi:M15 family metallopeptidase [Endozoicomonas sp. 2B-B]
MPSFSKTSKARLETCHPDLQRLMNKVVERFDCSIICGHRGKEEQEKAFREGKSQARFGQSKHNTIPSIAVDVAPYPIDWEDREYFAHFAGYVRAVADDLGIKIRWGGDWNMDNRSSDETFSDMPHFELMD